MEKTLKKTHSIGFCSMAHGIDIFLQFVLKHWCLSFECVFFHGISLDPPDVH